MLIEKKNAGVQSKSSVYHIANKVHISYENTLNFYAYW